MSRKHATSRKSDPGATVRVQRETEIPRFDLAQLARERGVPTPVSRAGDEHAESDRTPPSLPADDWVPVRTFQGDALGIELDLRSAFLLLHVDGRCTVAQIARFSGIAVEDVVATFEELGRRELVRLDGQTSSSRPAMLPPPSAPLSATLPPAPPATSPPPAPSGVRMRRRRKLSG